MFVDFWGNSVEDFVYLFVVYVCLYCLCVYSLHVLFYCLSCCVVWCGVYVGSVVVVIVVYGLFLCLREVS